MNAKDFDKIVAARMDWCEQILLAKGEEYSREGDRLWNFKSAGRKRNKHPAEALLDMKVKHDVSVDDIVDDLKRGVIPPKEFIAEKIGDSINYLLLLEGLIEEARAQTNDLIARDDLCEKLDKLHNDLTSIIHNSMPLSDTAKIFRERAKMYARSEVC